jgi:hypothetical protein
MPKGRPGAGSRESLTMGMRACGRGLTWNFVSGNESEKGRAREERLTTLEEVGKDGDEIRGIETLAGIDETTQVHIYKNISK